MGSTELPSSEQPVLFRRWLLRRMLPIALLLSGAVALVHASRRAAESELGLRTAEDVLELQHGVLARELEVAVSSVLDLAERPAVLAHLAGAEPREAVEREFLALCRHAGVFDQFRLIGEDGVERVRVNYGAGEPAAVPPEELQRKSSRYYLEAALELAPGEVYASPFDLNVEHERIELPWKPVMRVATPVAAGARRGLIVLNYRGDALLERLRQAARILGGWSALVDGRGYFLEAPTSERSWGAMRGEPPTFVRDHPEVWEAMRRAPAGAIELAGGLYAFRGFHAEGPLEPQRSELELRMVAYTPAAVLHAESRAALLPMLGAALVVALLLGLATWQLTRADALRASHERRLAESEQRLRELSSRLLDAQEAERRHVSRDLHDELGQIATAITIDLKQALRQPGEREPLLERAVEGTARLLDAIRDLSSRLRTTLLDDLGLADALLEHGAEFEARSGIATSIEVDPELAEVPPEVGIHVYRIVQESLNNVARHAGAKRARVSVVAVEGEVRVEVRDDGTGFQVEEVDGDRLGLVGMRERVELLAGRLELDSRPGGGTVVRAWIPLAGRAGLQESAP